MEKYLLAVLVSFVMLFSYGQEDCFKRLESAFKERGSQPITDKTYDHVIIVFFDKSGTFCADGKVRVEDGFVSSVFLYYEDDKSELLDKKFANVNKQPVSITNGISEIAQTSDGVERFRVVFINELKPKQKVRKAATLPDDL